MFIYLCLEKKQFFIYLNLYGGKIEENAVQSFVPVGQLYAWKWEGKMKWEKWNILSTLELESHTTYPVYI